jgi:hypothetical protein
MSGLFLVNVPYNCSERELAEWVESHGLEPESIRIVRDLVAGVSPAFGYVELRDGTKVDLGISVLNGQKIRNQMIRVSRARPQFARGAAGSTAKSA